MFKPAELRELIERKKLLVNNDKISQVGRIKEIPKLALTKKVIAYPIPQHYKVYIFHKPKGLICDSKDPTKLQRTTIFNYIKQVHKIKQKLYCCGKLDYNAEGLLLLTNSLEMYEVIEEVAKDYVYSYRIKVHGRFTDKKLENIRKGAVIKGKKFGPFFC